MTVSIDPGFFRGRKNRVQTKDIPDLPVLERLLEIRRTHNSWGCVFPDVSCSIVPGFPPGTCQKLVRSKIKSLVCRKLIKGCGCGCRGDLELTRFGLSVLHLARPGLFPILFKLRSRAGDGAGKFAGRQWAVMAGDAVEAVLLVWGTVKRLGEVFVDLTPEQERAIVGMSD